MRYCQVLVQDRLVEHRLAAGGDRRADRLVRIPGGARVDDGQVREHEGENRDAEEHRDELDEPLGDKHDEVAEAPSHPPIFPPGARRRTPEMKGYGNPL